MRTAEWYQEKIKEHTQTYKRNFREWLVELRKYPTTPYGKQEQKENCDYCRARVDEEWKLIKRYEKKLAEMTL